MEQKTALELFESKNNTLFWKYNTHKSKEWNTRYSGKEAGTIRVFRDKPYRYITIDSVAYPAASIIYLYHKGVWVLGLDHIDTNTLNNDITNLRPASVGENNCNVSIRKDNTSGYKNITDLGNGKFRVRVKKNGKTRSKTLTDLQEAIMLANKWRQELHGEFARQE